MLPTRPRLESRSMWISWTAPCSVTATRVSCGVTLMRICSFIVSGHVPPERAQQVRRLVQRQPHHAGVASLDALDEGACAALDAVAARLVERLAGQHVRLDARVVQGRERHQGLAHHDLETA